MVQVVQDSVVTSAAMKMQHGDLNVLENPVCYQVRIKADTHTIDILFTYLENEQKISSRKRASHEDEDNMDKPKICFLLVSDISPLL